MVSDLKDLQDVLGRFQDRSVQVEALRAEGEALAQVPGGPEALIALGSLIDALEADQREARAAFEGRFAAFASKQERRRSRPRSRGGGVKVLATYSIKGGVGARPGSGQPRRLGARAAGR